MKLITYVIACTPLLLATAACTSETTPTPEAESTTPPVAEPEPEALGETSEALVCGVTCRYAGYCSVTKPDRHQYHGYFYYCTSISQCGGSGYYTDCGAYRGASYCALYGGC